jgi:hypothetical protein
MYTVGPISLDYDKPLSSLSQIHHRNISKYHLVLGEPKQLKDSADDITELGV